MGQTCNRVTSIVWCAVLTGGCGGAGGSNEAEPDERPVSPPPEAVAEGRPVPRADAATGSGCSPNGGVVPDGSSVTKVEVVDVDGDGRRDEVWFSPQPTQRFGLATATGSVVATTVATAKPVDGIVVVDADGRAPVEVLVSDGASARLHVFDRCELLPVTGPDGEPYVFDLGYLGRGTGAICVDADGDGARDLVGVDAVENGDGTATVSRTVIELDGATARHGHTDGSTVPVGADREVLREAMGIRCGDMSITAEMLAGEPPG
jgi:hypothetical protein